MKKIYPLCLLFAAVCVCGCMLSSCTSDDGGDSPAPKLPGNSFVYDDSEGRIESVVYTVDEQKVYTFYFSPTKGIVDLEAMLLADDYIRIETAAPTGDIDLLAANNRLVYKEVDVYRANAGKVMAAGLSLQLTSRTTVKMKLAAMMDTGHTLAAVYEGTCIKHSEEDPGGEPGEDDYDVRLDKQIYCYYMGPDEGKAGTDGYYLAVTDAKFTAQGTKFELTSEGYALIVSFYGTPGESWRDMPTGSFTESNKHGDRTFDSEYSAVLYRDANGQQKLFQLIDPLKIAAGEAGAYTIEATFLDEKFEEHTALFEGSLTIGNATLNVYLPQVDRDIFIEGAYASGVYNGDVFENGSGMTEITIIDKKGENNEPNGYGMRLAIFNKKFANPDRERKLIPGTYTVSTTYEQGTWMPPVEMQIMGMVIPMGTYALYDDGTQTGQYAYAASGEIVIREGDTNTYTIEFDLKSILGHSIRGTYTGDVYLENQSADEKDDGSSTLEADYEMHMDKLPRANCFPKDEIWVRGLGTVPVSTACDYSGLEYGYQYIQLGTEQGIYEYTDEYPADKGKGKLIETDILGIDLLTIKGMEDQLIPGTYLVTTNRYPVYFRPGVCVCGWQGSEGTSMQFITSAIGWGYVAGYYDPTYKVANGWLNIPTFGEFASIYSGMVTVEKADGGDNWFTFTVDGRDVRKHRITGSWTGPVYLGTSDTPVLEGAIPQTRQAAAPSPITPSYREYRSRIEEQHARMPVRRPLQ